MENHCSFQFTGVFEREMRCNEKYIITYPNVSIARGDTSDLLMATKKRQVDGMG